MDPDHIRDLFSQFRRVEVRSMFGGAGIVADGLTIGFVFDGVIFLRVDEETIPEFKREGSVPFVYPLAKRTDRRPSRNFWRMPERLYDDPEDLARFAARSFAIAQRKKAGKAKTQPAKKPAKAKAQKPLKRAKKPAKRPAKKKSARRRPR